MEINVRDIIFQLLMFLMLLAIPFAIFKGFGLLRNRNNRLDRIEEKLDTLISEKKDKEQ